MSADDTRAPGPPAAPRLPARDPSEWLDALSDFARAGEDVTRLRGAWLFSHPDAVRAVLVTRDRSFVKSPALRRARFTLGNGLLTNEGETYRRQRALIQPSLHPKSLGGYAGMMARHAAETVARWQDGREVDVHREMTRLTLAIVAEALFSTSDRRWTRSAARWTTTSRCSAG
jgi:cytochrome P450